MIVNNHVCLVESLGVSGRKHLLQEAPKGVNDPHLGMLDDRQHVIHPPFLTSPGHTTSRHDKGWTRREK